jgi:DNA modification methylase
VIDTNIIHVGDCLQKLKELPDRSVDCIITSPPYFGLRDYGTATWEGGSAQCDHKAPHSNKLFGNPLFNENRPSRAATQTVGYRDVCGKCGARRIDSQIGLEPTFDEYIVKLVAIFRECRRVLKDTGTLWLNLGDKYLNKQLLLLPHRVAIALQDDGWVLRQEIVWEKSNVTPESVTDRCTRSHEYVFMFAKAAKRYSYGKTAIKEKIAIGDDLRPHRPDDTKNKSAVWAVSGATGKCADYFYDAEAIREPSKSLNTADAKRIGKGRMTFADGRKRDGKDGNGQESFVSVSETRNMRSVWPVPTKGFKGAHFAVFPEALIEPCVKAGCPEGGVILDPFMGSGTTAVVAEKHNRDWIGIELNPEYAAMARKRNADDGKRPRAGKQSYILRNGIMPSLAAYL